MADNDSNIDHWKVDKRIPVALLFAVFIQTGGGFWWASNITQRTNALEQKVEINTDIKERVIRLEIILERLERKFDNSGQ